MGLLSPTRPLGEPQPWHQPKTQSSVATHCSCKESLIPLISIVIVCKNLLYTRYLTYENLVLTKEVIVIIKISAQAQPNYVIVLEQEGEGETQYLYTGDLWWAPRVAIWNLMLDIWQNVINNFAQVFCSGLSEVAWSSVLVMFWNQQHFDNLNNAFTVDNFSRSQICDANSLRILKR